MPRDFTLDRMPVEGDVVEFQTRACGEHPTKPRWDRERDRRDGPSETYSRHSFGRSAPNRSEPIWRTARVCCVSETQFEVATTDGDAYHWRWPLPNTHQWDAKRPGWVRLVENVEPADAAAPTEPKAGDVAHIETVSFIAVRDRWAGFSEPEIPTPIHEATIARGEAACRRRRTWPEGLQLKMHTMQTVGRRIYTWTWEKA